MPPSIQPMWLKPASGAPLERGGQVGLGRAQHRAQLHVLVRVVAARALRAEEQRRHSEALVDEGVARPLRGGDPDLWADYALRRAEQARGPGMVGRLLVSVERRVEHALEAHRIAAEE